MRFCFFYESVIFLVLSLGILFVINFEDNLKYREF